MLESDMSTGPFSTYTSATNTFSASTDPNRFLTNSYAAINDAGTRIALSLDNRTIQMFDAARTLVTTIPSAYGGLAFKPGTNLLYVADDSVSQIRVFDGDNGWTQTQTIAVGETLTSISPNGQGNLAFDANGTRLFLLTASGVRMYLLSPPMYVTASIPSNTGVRINVSKAAVPGVLNLYDYVDSGGNGVLGTPDVQLVG